jgi:hypothetical protein
VTSPVFTPGTRVRIVGGEGPIAWVGRTGTIIERYPRRSEETPWDWRVAIRGVPGAAGLIAFYESELEPLS